MKWNQMLMFMIFGVFESWLNYYHNKLREFFAAWTLHGWSKMPQTDESWLIQIDSFRPFQSAPNLRKIFNLDLNLFDPPELILQPPAYLAHKSKTCIRIGACMEKFGGQLFFVFFVLFHRDSHKVVVLYGWFKRMLESAEMPDVEIMNSWWEMDNRIWGFLGKFQRQLWRYISQNIVGCYMSQYRCSGL